eukprot:NODE_1298_length_917_cov_160.731646_g1252_i0.p1 GENE.NODE_1298_length_917_cov_160.731646_g1252_i0~~NODE_1298_length_917_cov_160.731646_g1252_i0.p1  ORF type:complete len:233 (+),score=72.88 NODE_1298_length_917_cov_160.731646_g1252_i0:94-792(+)
MPVVVSQHEQLVSVFETTRGRTPTEAESAHFKATTKDARDVQRWTQIIENSDDTLDVTAINLPPMPKNVNVEDVALPSLGENAGSVEEHKAFRQQLKKETADEEDSDAGLFSPTFSPSMAARATFVDGEQKRVEEEQRAAFRQRKTELKEARDNFRSGATPEPPQVPSELFAARARISDLEAQVSSLKKEKVQTADEKFDARIAAVERQNTAMKFALVGFFVAGIAFAFFGH